eukprot:gene7588-biopygen1516
MLAVVPRVPQGLADPAGRGFIGTRGSWRVQRRRLGLQRFQLRYGMRWGAAALPARAGVRADRHIPFRTIHV